MGKIWLKSVDPSHRCCGCEGKAGPCDNCTTCVHLYPTVFPDLSTAQAFMIDNFINCIFVPFGASPISSWTSSQVGNALTLNFSFTTTSTTFIDSFGFSFLQINLSTNTNFKVDYSASVSPTISVPTSISLGLFGICSNPNSYSISDSAGLGLPINGSQIINNVQAGYYNTAGAFNIFPGGIFFPAGFTFSFHMVITDLINPSLDINPIVVEYSSPTLTQITCT